MSDWHQLQFKWLGCQLILIAIWFQVCLSIASQIQVVWLSTDLKFKWLGYQLKSSDLRFIDFDLVFRIHLRFKWCGCRLIGNSIDWVVEWSEIFRVGCHWIWDWNDLVVEWFELQMILLSIDYLKVKWYSYRLVWTSSVLVGHWFESQMMRLSSDLKFKFKCFVPIPKRQSVFGQKRHLWFCHPMRRHRNPKRQALDSYTTTLMFRDNSKPTKNPTRQKLFFQSTKLRHSEVYMPAVTCGQYKHTRPCPCAVSRNTRMDFFGTQH